MVLQSEYSSPGFAQQNYSQEASYKDASYYGNNSSSMQMMRPNPGYNGPSNNGMNGYGAGVYGGGGYGNNNGMNRPNAYYGGGGGPGNGAMYPQHGGYGSGGYGNVGYGNSHHGSTHMMPMGSTNRMEESRYEYQGSSGGPFGHQRNQNSWVSKDLDD